MNKKTVIVIVIGVLLIAGGLFSASKVIFEKKKTQSKQTIAAGQEEEVNTDEVKVDLKADSEKKEVTMTITGLGEFTSLEYELSYDTKKGPKGTLSGSKPIVLSSGQNEFIRTITLGTCSKNVCTYDEEVSNIGLVLKLYPEKGEPQILKKSFDL